MGIKIDIDGEWGIMSDDYSYILGQWTTREKTKDGEKIKVKTLKNRTYHGTITQLLRAYKKEKTLSSKAESFKELIKIHERIMTTIDKIKDKLEV